MSDVFFFQEKKNQFTWIIDEAFHMTIIVSVIFFFFSLPFLKKEAQFAQKKKSCWFISYIKFLKIYINITIYLYIYIQYIYQYMKCQLVKHQCHYYFVSLVSFKQYLGVFCCLAKMSYNIKIKKKNQMRSVEFSAKSWRYFLPSASVYFLCNDLINMGILLISVLYWSSYLKYRFKKKMEFVNLLFCGLVAWKCHVCFSFTSL